ncbi:hypothetical protein, partial [Belnapia arida]|uniref:hypothetical protein n=1 Tax=Belnapia arida TaxID=2804533 RepID=UPI001F3CD46F
MVAGLAVAFLASPGPTTAAEIASRPVAFRASSQDDQARVWGLFSFGMAPAQAHRAALRMGGLLVLAAGASTSGQPAAYHGRSNIRSGRQSRSDLALVWFDGVTSVNVVEFADGLRVTTAQAGRGGS